MIQARLSLIIPTFNEAGNIDLLIATLTNVLNHLDWEVVFVDDNSVDSTYEIVAKYVKSDSRIRLIRRFGRKGLASACIEGVLATDREVIVVMDADLQHDVLLIPVMLRRLLSDHMDLVVASRYVKGGRSVRTSLFRGFFSRLTSMLTCYLIPVRVTDPLSGFFIVRRNIFVRAIPSMYGKGFKILLDILASGVSPSSITEEPLLFSKRYSGRTKLNVMVFLYWLLQVFWIRRNLAARMARYPW